MHAACRLGIAALLLALVAPAQAPALRVDREVAVRAAPRAVASIAWSADGRWIACGGRNGVVFVVDAETGGLAHEWTLGSQPVGRVVFAPDSASLAAAGEDVAVWDLQTGAVRRRWSVASSTALAWGGIGARLAFAPSPRSVRVLDGADLSLVHELSFDDQAVVADVAVAPDGVHVAVATASGTVRTFDLSRPQQPTDERVAREPVALQWLADGRLLRQGPNGALLGFESLRDTVPRAQGLAADPAGRLVLAWNPLALVGCAGGARFRAPGGGPVAVAADGERWVRAVDGALEFRRGPQVTHRLPLPAMPRDDLRRAVLTADGRYAVVEHDDGIACVDLAGAHSLPVPAEFRGWPVPYGGGPEILLWQPHTWGSRTEVDRLCWWVVVPDDPQPMRCIRELGVSGGAGGLRLDRTGRYATLGARLIDLVAGGALVRDTQYTDGDVFPAADGATVLRVGGHEEPFLALTDCVPRNGKLELATADGRVLASHEFEHAVQWVGFSRDGRQIGVCTADGLHLLTADRLEEVAVAEGRWDCASWVDGGRLLLATAESEARLELRDRRGARTDLPLPGPVRSLAVDGSGARAIAVLADRIVVLRIGR